MSKANLQAFYKAFRTNPNLQKELDGITNTQEYVTKATSLGASQGLEFTAAEVEAALAQPALFLEETLGEELNDLELSAVSGGGILGCGGTDKGDE